MKNIVKFFVLVVVAGFQLQTYALDIVNLEAVPPSYGTVVETEDENGNLVEEVKFKGAGTAWSAGSLNAIMNAYGRALDVESAEYTPRGFAKVGTIIDPETGEENQAVVGYGQAGIAWYPRALHEVLTAYGLTPDFEKAIEQLPKEYANVIQVEDPETGELKDVLQFKSGGVAWRASALAKIIDSYQIDSSI